MLGDFQKKVSGVVLTCGSIIVIALFAVGLLWVMGQFISVFGAVIWPLVIAVIASFILKPLVDIFKSYFKISESWACFIIFFILVVVMLCIALFAVPKIAGQLVDMTASLFDFVKEAAHKFAQSR